MKAGPFVRGLYSLYQAAQEAESKNKGFLLFTYHARNREYVFNSASEIKNLIEKVIATAKDIK